MKIKTVTFYKKLKPDTPEKTVTCKIQEPSIIAKSWYQMNTNHALEYIIFFRGNIDDFKIFDAVKIDGHTYFLANLTAPGSKSLRGEIGS